MKTITTTLFLILVAVTFSFAQVRPLFAVTTEYTSGVPLFGLGAGFALGEQGRFGIGANYELPSTKAKEEGVEHNYLGLVSFFNVYQQERASMSLFLRGGHIGGQNWIIIPGFSANYHFTPHVRGSLFAGIRPDNPTFGIDVIFTPFKRPVWY